ncbi:MAG: hypothetical protein NTY53_26025 [Kiritimatiellaeota bacterium]|nr:hypothetical protein [Kiritimatiellota bacterium]
MKHVACTSQDKNFVDWRRHAAAIVPEVGWFSKAWKGGDSFFQTLGKFRRSKAGARFISFSTDRVQADTTTEISRHRRAS